MSSFLHGKTITPELLDEWHKARQPRLGASEMASAMGINKFDSTLRLWLSKTGKLPPKEANEAMEIGSALESAILDLYQRRSGKRIIANQMFFVASAHDFLCATLDGITEDGINVQAKNVGCASVSYWGEAGTDEIPHQVIVQVQQEMLCSGLDLTHVVALLGGSEIRIYHVPRNNTVIHHIIKKGGEFIDRVRKMEYPQPDRDRDQELIKHLFTGCMGTVEFDERQSADVIKWERLGAEIKGLESVVKKLKMDILMAMGNASQAKLVDGRVLHRSIVNVGASVRSVKAYSYPLLSVRRGQEDQ